MATAQESWLDNQYVSEDVVKGALINAAAIASAQTCAQIAQTIVDITMGETDAE